MWILTVRSSSSNPIEYKLKPGRNILGRKPDNDIVIDDVSASRVHAEIYCQSDLAVIHDLNSTNGTFVNRERLNKPIVLQTDDQIRIGHHVATIIYQEQRDPSKLINALSGTRTLTRELLAEAVDKNAVLLYEVAGQLAKILNLETALDEITKLMRVAVGSENCGVILAKDFGQMEKLGLPSEVGRQAIEQRSVVIISDLAAQAGISSNIQASTKDIHSILCVPVIIDEEIAALMFMYDTNPNARPFDQHDIQLAVAISYQATLAIDRANLIEKAQLLEKWAITDSLTNLHNRRHILYLASLEIQRAQRYKHSFSMLMLDVDEFKQINDTFGHIVGDQVLVEVAECLKKELRSTDLIGRYGGDEFVILLVETELNEAIGIAERTRQRIAERTVGTDRGPMNITVSIGIADVSEKNPDLAAIFKLADDALYLAKKKGKNRVEIL